MFKKPNSLTKIAMRYCPGCGHGIIHRLIAEVIDEFDIREKTVGIAPVGCSVFLDEYFDTDVIQTAHGRAPAVATGMKRCYKDIIVFAYQGDGDLAAIGTAETIHSATRGENFTIIFINNAIYGMTGGQQAPTTMPGQKTTTTLFGRDPKIHGYPLKVCEMLATLDGPIYIERVAVHKAVNVIRAKKSIKKAFKAQIDGLGFSLVEILSPCPTGWGIAPLKACEYMDKIVIPYYPLGVFKDLTQTNPKVSEPQKIQSEKPLEKKDIGF